LKAASYGVTSYLPGRQERRGRLSFSRKAKEDKLQEILAAGVLLGRAGHIN
jgi:hypothetical protein